MDFKALKMDGEKIEHEFNLESLPEGVFRITLFNTEGAVLATRSFYHQNVNVNMPTLSVSADKSSYYPFEKV